MGLLDFDFTSLLSVLQQLRNPAIANELPRVQGAVPPSEKVSYLGGKWGFSFFGWHGRIIGLPDNKAHEALKACRDLEGPKRLWEQLTGLA